MKNIIFWLFLSINLLLADGVFFIDKQSGSVTMENVVSNVLSSTPPVIGQTYKINDQNYAIKTDTNSEVVIFFSNDTFIKAKELSHFTLDVFDQQFTNINSLPEKVQYQSYSLSLSLIDGELEVLASSKESSDSFFTVNTSMASFILNKGRYIITSDSKATILVVVDGNATALDHSSKKKEIVSSGNTLIILPEPKFQGRGMDLLMKKGNMFTSKEVPVNFLESCSNRVNQLNGSIQRFRFVVIDKTVRGVRID